MAPNRRDCRLDWRITTPRVRTEGPISLTFSPDEALVLFEFVVRSDNAESLPVIDHAEQIVLWRLEAQLEKSLVEPFDPRVQGASG